jgi:hypothetical protein
MTIAWDGIERRKEERWPDVKTTPVVGTNQETVQTVPEDLSVWVAESDYPEMQYHHSATNVSNGCTTRIMMNGTDSL